ncbi:unnamed protein product [Absidia cylindrospora]
MQEMNSSMLGSQSLKQLKQYIKCYNLPSQHAIEKDDLVKLIFNTRPITNQNERHYRKLRDQQYAGQVSGQEREGANNDNNNNGGDLFDDNPLSTMFNKLSDLFIPPDPAIPSSAPVPPRQRQQQQQQQRRRPPPSSNQRQQQHYQPPPQTSTQQHTPSSSYPSYIYPEHQHQHPSSAPRSTTTSATTGSSPRQQASSASAPPPPPPPSSTPSPPGNTITLKEMLSLSIDPATMSVRTLKHILRTNHVEQNFALEKKELVTRVQQLIDDEKKLQKERSHLDSDISSSGNGGDDIHEDMVCRICYDSVQNCVFLNCGHMATCIDCGLKVK